ncbi:hypothetical protein Barb4_02436 [Bacteroidales bacterium Barb4]|nr:hypothetical protein Barb4_02436 [Bacteroidales bacterium Barb4]
MSRRDRRFQPHMQRRVMGDGSGKRVLKKRDKQQMMVYDAIYYSVILILMIHASALT